MASEDENSKGFKIQDRRRFSAEGDLKPEFSGADEPAAAKPEAPRPGGAPPSAGAQAFAQAKRRLLSSKRRPHSRSRRRRRRATPPRDRRPPAPIRLKRAPKRARRRAR